MDLFCWNLNKITHFEPIQATLVTKLAIAGHFESLWLEMIQNVANLRKLDDETPLQWKFLRFLQKWDALVGKDWKSCKSGEIGYSKGNLSLFLGKNLEKV